MDKTLLSTIMDKVCLSFDEDCDRCPFGKALRKVGASCCSILINYHQREAELALARYIAGDTAMDAREVLQAAESCGGPENSFSLVAELWAPIIRARCVPPGTEVTLDAVTVALLMTELKIARAATNTGHMDNWVDLAGYAACGGDAANEEKSREKK